MNESLVKWLCLYAPHIWREVSSPKELLSKIGWLQKSEGNHFTMHSLLEEENDITYHCAYRRYSTTCEDGCSFCEWCKSHYALIYNLSLCNTHEMW